MAHLKIREGISHLPKIIEIGLNLGQISILLGYFFVHFTTVIYNSLEAYVEG